ncbi:RNA polymerase sigma factor [Flavihumibacter petaseus]|uniref:Putative RNA polymerase ECF-type sigma factor n=1 Tax=Flavihumibacter petaseus NBRC 106054 TaxID=1220578 RepID=A0A0E9MWL7_9BACT|nr:sigma-70 family RNA polymerase sigma factor [Flavihumibacter petaseus]GAO41883.1 putative RNA polymerase ECF-type sigma factor [Flavihumibacter petaseus NBRC 106054]
MSAETIVPHLFRSEYKKIIAVLCRNFGWDQLDQAEDIASETFLTAAQVWALKGPPPEPVAWLYTVAKNKARTFLKRQQVYQQKVVPALQHDEAPQTEIDLSADGIRDSQLRMIFAVCHPSLPMESQVALALRILCGFSISEIAMAFMTNTETISKRLYRAREKLRVMQVLPEVPSPEALPDRLEAVLQTIYLLFNEGYYSSCNNQLLQKDICYEAMQLCSQLLEYSVTAVPPAQALMALMCFHASRFDARLAGDDLVLYGDQDTSRWNQEFIRKGVFFLHHSARGEQLSRYHLEAGIAWWHTRPGDSPEKWQEILQRYTMLLELSYSPLVDLNRIYALAKVSGAKAGITAAREWIAGADYPPEVLRYYHLLLGTLFLESDTATAAEHLAIATSLAGTGTERSFLTRRYGFL